MQRNTYKFILVSLSMAWLSSSMPAFADVQKTSIAATRTSARASDRLIVKLKASATAVVGADRINALKEHPLTARELGRINSAAGIGMSEHHQMSSGAHVLSMPGIPGKLDIAQAIAAIGKLPNVEYVEEDTIETAQFVPNDSRYAANQMWGMQPVIPAGVNSSPGAVGRYGADFQTAWDTSTGSGIVVAVVDTGITPHIDIGGPNALVTSGSGSNLVAAGYTFVSDCRMRGTTATGGCAASTLTANAAVAPSAGALDTGDYITSQDVIDNPALFPATTDSSWHGTHVAGIIAALGNNGISVIGGAYKAKLLPVRVLGKGGGYLSDIAEALRWAAGVHPTISNPNPAQVINLSVGGLDACGPTQQDAIDAAVAAGTVVVVAAGNENMDAAAVHPASCNNVISVAAIAKDGQRASYSNYSSGASATTITLAAPGGDFAIGSGTYDPGIVSTINPGLTTPETTYNSSYYTFMTGTSMAAPHVSAAAALMLSRNTALTPALVKSILSSPTSVTAFPAFDVALATTDCAAQSNCGAGILDAALAVNNSIVLSADVVPTNFGSVESGGTVTKTVTWTNVTASSVTVLGSASITGTNSSFFTIESCTCDSTIITSGGTCAATLKYAPTSPGSHSAVLTVPSTPLASGVNLVGTESAPAPPPVSSGGDSGGGGCAVMAFGASPDISLLLALLAVGAYWQRRRIVRICGAA